MINRPAPYARMAFVCTNERPEGHPKPCCGRRGGRELRARLREMVEERGGKGTIKVFQSGCLGGCEFGPVMLTVDDRQLRFQVGEDDLEAIVDELMREED